MKIRLNNTSNEVSVTVHAVDGLTGDINECDSSAPLKTEKCKVDALAVSQGDGSNPRCRLNFDGNEVVLTLGGGQNRPHDIIYLI